MNVLISKLKASRLSLGPCVRYNSRLPLHSVFPHTALSSNGDSHSVLQIINKSHFHEKAMSQGKLLAVCVKSTHSVKLTLNDQQM